MEPRARAPVPDGGYAAATARLPITNGADVRHALHP